MTMRQVVPVRIAEAGIERIDRIASAARAELGQEVTRTDILRTALAMAFQNESALMRQVVQLKRQEAERL